MVPERGIEPRTYDTNQPLYQLSYPGESLSPSAMSPMLVRYASWLGILIGGSVTSGVEAVRGNI